MGVRSYLGLVTLMAGVCVLMFYLFQVHLTNPWMRVATNPEVNDLLVMAIVNQRELAKLRPEESEVYKQQFEKTQELLANLEILQANRSDLFRRYRWTLLSGFGVSLLVLLVTQWVVSRRAQRRLQHIARQVDCLAVGVPGSSAPLSGAGFDAKISTLIHDASKRMEKDRERLKYMEHLRGWQENFRRLAHEIRTPITAIKLEVTKWAELFSRTLPDSEPNWKPIHKSISEELDGLLSFTHAFNDFAKTGKPSLETLPLLPFLERFVDLYQKVWPKVSFSLPEAGPEHQVSVAVDKPMLRQVLVNLCTNTFHALEGREGRIQFFIQTDSQWIELTVTDNGPGIPMAMRDRIFEPYVTTKPHGKGMGLGLPLSRKIMLDHGGDLIYLARVHEGACFKLTFPRRAAKQPQEVTVERSS